MTIEKDDFRRWLENGKGYAGIRGRACSCPIARYLLEVKAAPDPMVGNWTISLGGVSASRFATPDWAKAFISAVDSGGDGVNVTRKKALKILDGVSAEGGA